MRGIKILDSLYRSGPTFQCQWKLGEKQVLREALKPLGRDAIYYKAGFFAASTVPRAFHGLPRWFQPHIDAQALKYVVVEMSGEVVEEVPGVFVCSEMTIVSEIVV